MKTLDIDTAFWRIFDKVKREEELEASFIHTAGSVASMMTMGFMGCIVWSFASGIVRHCYGHETLVEKMERINRTRKQREQFVLKLSQDLGYKDNWRRMFTDFESGFFHIDKITIANEMITK